MSDRRKRTPPPQPRFGGAFLVIPRFLVFRDRIRLGHASQPDYVSCCRKAILPFLAPPSQAGLLRQDRGPCGAAVFGRGSRDVSRTASVCSAMRSQRREVASNALVASGTILRGFLFSQSKIMPSPPRICGRSRNRAARRKVEQLRGCKRDTSPRRLPGEVAPRRILVSTHLRHRRSVGGVPFGQEPRCRPNVDRHGAAPKSPLGIIAEIESIGFPDFGSSGKRKGDWRAPTGSIHSGNKGKRPTHRLARIVRFRIVRSESSASESSASPARTVD
jgi:hypothetical protein